MSPTPQPPRNAVVLNPATLGFAIAMLVLGVALGYFAGRSQPAPPTAPVAAAPATPPAPDGKVVNNSGGQIRRLSDEEKAELIAKRGQADAQAEPQLPAASVYWSQEIQDSFADDISRAEYQRAAALMARGNARGARAALEKLAADGAGKAWGLAAQALLASAQAATAEVEAARATIAAFRKAAPKDSPLAATVAIAEAKTYQQEGKRVRAADPAALPPDRVKLYEQAIAGYAAAAAQWPGHEAVADGLLNEVALLVELGRLADAEREATALAVGWPEHEYSPRGLANVARAAGEAGDGAAAERLWQQLVDRFPRDRMAAQAREQIGTLALLNKPAPAIEAEEWLGDATPLSELNGKAALLVFWATWCPHCKKEMPHTEEVWNKFRKRGLAVVGVTRHTRGQTTESVRSFVGEKGLTFPIAVDTGGTSRAYGVSGIPAAALIDRQGRVVKRGHPAQITDAEIEALLGG